MPQGSTEGIKMSKIFEVDSLDTRWSKGGNIQTYEGPRQCECCKEGWEVDEPDYEQARKDGFEILDYGNGHGWMYRKVPATFKDNLDSGFTYICRLCLAGGLHYLRREDSTELRCGSCDQHKPLLDVGTMEIVDQEDRMLLCEDCLSKLQELGKEDED